MTYNMFALSASPPPLITVSLTDDYWKGTIDTNMAQIKLDVAAIRDSLKDICADITKVQVQAARDGGLYGGGAGIGVYLLGLLAQLLKKKGKGGGK